MPKIRKKSLNCLFLLLNNTDDKCRYNFMPKSIENHFPPPNIRQEPRKSINPRISLHKLFLRYPLPHDDGEI